MYEFTYLSGVLIFFIPWLILFLWRKDIRKEMLLMGLLFSIASPIGGYLWYTVDWWHPETITNTRIGIEDVLLGFSNGGIIAVVYEVVFRKKFKDKKEVLDPESFKKISFIILITFFIMIFGFSVLRLHSFYANVIGILIPSLIILYKRKDLIKNSIITGFLTAILSVPVYLILEFIFPGVIVHTWYIERLSGTLFLGIPVEDLIWYFFAGVWGGPLYEYCKNLKLKSMKN